MKLKRCWILIVLASIFLMGSEANGRPPKVPPELIGTWDYASMSPFKNGKPFGTVHFQPGQWTVTFNPDGKWVMKTPSPPNPAGLNGSSEVHGHDLDMKLSNGNSYNKYHFAIEQEGKVLVLTTKEASITANRE